MNEVEAALQSTCICLPDAHTLPWPYSQLGTLIFKKGFILAYSSRGLESIMAD